MTVTGPATTTKMSALSLLAGKIEGGPLLKQTSNNPQHLYRHNFRNPAIGIFFLLKLNTDQAIV